MAQPTSASLPVDMVMNKVIEELERGQEYMHLTTTLIDQQLKMEVEHDIDYLKTLDDHTAVAFNTILNSLSLLKMCTNNATVASADHFVEKTPKNGTTTKERRGCYKRRRMGEEAKEMEVTQLADDGYAWRKYGQKTILNSNHPRNYFRCTHKHDQNCQAVKQVQQISDSPPKYKIVYHGTHTCKNTLKSSPIIINLPEQHSSAIFLDFESKRATTKHSDQLFLTSIYPNAADTELKQEQCAFMTEEGISVSHESYDVCNQYPSTSSSQCPTAAFGVSSTPVFDQSDNSTANSYLMEEDYNNLIWGGYSGIDL